MSNRLESGKTYTAKNGKKIGPMREVEDGEEYPFCGCDEEGDESYFTAEGRYFTDGESPYDIVFPSAKWQLRYDNTAVETFDSEDMAKMARLMLRPEYVSLYSPQYTVVKVEG
jgi:hypothetical protein